MIMVVREGQFRLILPSHPSKDLLVLVIIPLPISWKMSLLCIECYLDKKLVSVEICL